MTDSQPTVAVVTDSTADIPPAQCAELGIAVVPAVLTMGGETFADGVDISREEFYRRLPHLTEPATTGAPSPLAFEKAYERALSAGANKVLSIHLSSKLSGLLNAATQAAKTFGDRVRTFDSGQVSLGLGFQAMEAAAASLAHGSFEAVMEAAQRARESVKLIAMIDTLNYLHRSGRISWLTAGLGNLLQVKLLLEVVDGVANRLGQVRTKTKALDQLAALASNWGPLERLAIAHSAAPTEAESFSQRLKHLCERPPLIAEVTSAIGAHIGPGAIGVIALTR